MKRVFKMGEKKLTYVNICTKKMCGNKYNTMRKLSISQGQYKQNNTENNCIKIHYLNLLKRIR